MHSPETLAFEIKSPFKDKSGYRKPLISIWHNDPCIGGGDSCGWFMRSHHGNPEIQKKIRSAIEFSFDRTFTSNESDTTYYTGYFSPNTGMPNYSTLGITLNMFNTAAWEFFKYNRKKHTKWMKNNLYEILQFAENPVDSLKDDILGTFRIGTGETWNREYALNNYTSIIYGWLLRETRPWYKHPRWHIHHWNIEFHPIKSLKRRFWDKCSVCGKRGFKESAMSDWYGKTIWHQACDKSIKTPTSTDI